MKSQRFNLDPGENDRINRILKALFGLVCIAAAITTGIMLTGSDKLTTNSFIAIAFMGLIGISLLISGLGLTERFLTLTGDTIILRDKVYAPARTISVSDLRKVEFSQLKVAFYLKSEEVISLRLGTFYRESPVRIMEALEKFCASNGVLTEGLPSNRDDDGHEN